MTSRNTRTLTPAVELWVEIDVRIILEVAHTSEARAARGGHLILDCLAEVHQKATRLT
jgi:hypothetical protein